MGEHAARARGLTATAHATVAAGAADLISAGGELVSNGDDGEGELLKMLRRRLLQSFLVLSLLGAALAQSGGELKFCLRNEPKTFNPLLVQDDASEAIRYMTGGMLARV